MRIEEMKQALKALEHSHANEPIWKTPHRDAITSLRQAIEQAEKQEPVAWMLSDVEKPSRLLFHKPSEQHRKAYSQVDELYTTPLNPMDSIKSSKTLDAQPQQFEKQELSVLAKQLRYELLGVITDVEEGIGFNDICLNTIKYVHKQLADLEPQREWVGLTDAEIEEFDYYARDLVMDIEKALKERNNVA
jgi:hypothetical protein